MEARLWGVIHREGRKSRQISGIGVFRQIGVSLAGQLVMGRLQNGIGKR
jgi:hypothetical protein